MPKRLAKNAKVKRELLIDGIPAPISVEMTQFGIRMSVRGSKKWISVLWPQVIAAMRTTPDVPSYLMSRPMEFLMWQAKNYRIKGRSEKIEPAGSPATANQGQLQMWPD
jgi:hypothetical protein